MGVGAQTEGEDSGPLQFHAFQQELQKQEQSCVKSKVPAAGPLVTAVSAAVPGQRQEDFLPSPPTVRQVLLLIPEGLGLCSPKDCSPLAVKENKPLRTWQCD